MNTPLGYVRVSTDRQDLSVEAQASAIQRAADYLKLGPVKIFAEPGTSGSLPFLQREEGRNLVKQVELLAGQCTILVNKVDRLGRDSVDVNQTVRLLDSLGARVVFLDINVDTRTPMGKAFMQIAAVFAELEVARIRERIQSALDEKRAQGLLTGTEPYGWNAVSTGVLTAKGVPVRRLEPNPEEQQWILHMHRCRQAGWSYHAIAKDLNARKIPTKTGAGNVIKYKGEPRFSKGKWQCGNVRKVLINKTVQSWLGQAAANQKLAA